MLLVGNKTDLGEASRKVYQQEVLPLIKGWGNCLYMETSAKEKVNVNEAFTALLRMIIEAKKRVLEKSGMREKGKNKSCSCTIQ